MCAPGGIERSTRQGAVGLGISDLLRRAVAGNDIVVERHGAPISAPAGSEPATASNVGTAGVERRVVEAMDAEAAMQLWEAHITGASE